MEHFYIKQGATYEQGGELVSFSWNFFTIYSALELRHVLIVAPPLGRAVNLLVSAYSNGVGAHDNSPPYPEVAPFESEL